jgi:LETM1 and EF-hand domain-containing protein 1
VSSSNPPTTPEEKQVQVKKTLWERFKHEVNHYKHGMKLFGKELVITSRYIGVVSSGGTLNRRQRQQLVRTSADLMRMVPFLFFVIVPFMEFFLPVAIRLFPNMLPSTFRSAYS